MSRRKNRLTVKGALASQAACGAQHEVETDSLSIIPLSFTPFLPHSPSSYFFPPFLLLFPFSLDISSLFCAVRVRPQFSPSPEVEVKYTTKASFNIHNISQ